MEQVIKSFERIVVLALLGIMMLAVFVSTVELAVIFYEQLMKPPVFFLNIEEMLEVFGFLLMVLIGLELLETIKSYLEDDIVHAEVVFLVAIVAVARKIVILDYKELSPQLLYGIAAVVLALSLGYFLVKRAMNDSTITKRPRSQ